MKTNNIVNKYKEFRKTIDNKTDQTIRSEQYTLQEYQKFLNKPFKDATEEDVMKFLNLYKETTQNTIIGRLRPFYRWLFDIDNGDPLPACIKRIKNRKRDTNIEYRERIITPNEYQRLIDFTSKPVHKAIIETLYLFGVRISELLSMTSTDVKYDGKNTKITIRESKTKTRDVLVKGRAEHLLTYFESYQLFKGQEGKPLWVGREGKFTGAGILIMIKRTAKHAGLKRNITNHDFRHTSITRDRNEGVPMTFIELKHGLVHGSLMMQRYDHNKTKDHEAWLNAKRGETPATYKALKEQKESLEQKHEREINNLKTVIGELKGIITDLNEEVHKMDDRYMKLIDKIK